MCVLSITKNALGEGHRYFKYYINFRIYEFDLMGKVIFKTNENNNTIKSTVDQILQRKGGTV